MPKVLYEHLKKITDKDLEDAKAITELWEKAIKYYEEHPNYLKEKFGLDFTHIKWEYNFGKEEKE